MVAADLGATLRVVVTASNSAGSSEASSAQTQTVVAAGETTVTFSIAAGGDDGDVSVSAPQPAATRPRAARPPTQQHRHPAGRRAAFGKYEVLNSLLRFDTSALPDNATVTSAKLRGYLTSVADDDDRTLVGEWYSAANWPIDRATGRSPPAPPPSPAPTSPASNKNSTVELTLANPSSLSLTGPSALRLGISGGQPNADNYLKLATLEHTSPAGVAADRHVHRPVEDGRSARKRKAVADRGAA